MHNSVPQMGYYHSGLGAFIYNEDRIPQLGLVPQQSYPQMGYPQMGCPQMGNANYGMEVPQLSGLSGFDDILQALTRAAETTAKSPQASQLLNNFVQTGSLDLNALQDPALANIYASLMKVPDFAAAEAKVIQTGIQNKTLQFTKTLTDTVKQYQTYILIAVVLSAVGAAWYFNRRK